MEQNGLLRQIFIRTPDDEANPSAQSQSLATTDKSFTPQSDHTYSAREGRIVTKDNRSILIMKDGNTQAISGNKMLDHLTFQEYSFDITDYFVSDAALHYHESDRYLHELFFPNMAHKWESDNWGKLFAQGHMRLSTPLYALSFAYLAIIAVLAGRFQRTGYSVRISAALALALMIRILGIAVESACNNLPWLNFMQYVVPIIPIIICHQALAKKDGNGALTFSRSAHHSQYSEANAGGVL